MKGVFRTNRDIYIGDCRVTFATEKRVYLKTLSKEVGGWSRPFQKILMNLFLTLVGGNFLFNNADPTYF